MVKCTINGHEVEVEAGSTIIQAFQKVSQDIAHYCWHPGLSIAGVCRMCVVEIEGNPRPQIACNTVVTEGMKITNQTEKIQDAVKWVLEFHLINHPLDCPICDQAGECGLQEYYMKHGKYDPEMGEKKVKKRKVIELGPRVVLDSERCILCSRCVRFTDEVTKTNELGIFNRGDRSEIGTFEDKPLNNNYSLNTVDICPVGALTSKDFRFKQRAWFLKEFNSVCTGCSTGCNVKVYHNENGLYRVKPVYNPEVNGYWMCDEGRDIYKYLNLEHRLTKARQKTTIGTKELTAGSAAKQLASELKSAVAKSGAKSVGLVVTGQYTNEELEAMMNFVGSDLGSDQVFHWVNNPESFEKFDGILNRGDKNPNTHGLLGLLEKKKFQKTWGDLEKSISSGAIQTLIVLGPENQAVYPDMASKIQLFKKVPQVIWFSACKNAALDDVAWQIPVKSFVEKSGTFVNYKGIEQKIQRGTTIVSQALTLTEAATLLSGRELTISASAQAFSA